MLAYLQNTPQEIWRRRPEPPVPKTLLPSLVLSTVTSSTGSTASASSRHMLSVPFINRASCVCRKHSFGSSQPKGCLFCKFLSFFSFFLIYFSLAVLGLRCCTGLSLVAASAPLWFWSTASRARGLSSCSQRGLGCLL